MSKLTFSPVFGRANGTLFVRVAQKAFKKLAGTNIMIEDASQTRSGFIEVQTEKDQEELIAVLESGVITPRFGKTPNEQGAYPVTLVEAGERVAADGELDTEQE